MNKTNFDLYLDEQLKDPDFAERFKRAGEAWDVAMQLAALREKAGLSQKELARKLKTSQQNVSRLESPSYEGHSLSMLRRVAGLLGATVRVVIEPRKNSGRSVVAETAGPYRNAWRTKRSSNKAVET
jgi:transcriptional regulator with XRE-family HTH domain